MEAQKNTMNSAAPFVCWRGLGCVMFGTIAEKSAFDDSVYVMRTDGTKCGPLWRCEMVDADADDMAEAFRLGSCSLPQSMVKDLNRIPRANWEQQR